MNLVVDANILFAALIKDNVTADLLVSNGYQLYAPEFIFAEFNTYKELILNKTKRTSDEFEQFLNLLRRRITLVPKEKFTTFIDEAKRVSPDENDILYLATALSLRCAIWSNDKALKKQNNVRVYHTHELVNNTNDAND